MIGYALVAAFIGSFVLGVILVLLVFRIAPGVGLVDLPGGRKQHAGPTYLGGGIAIFFAATLPLAAAVFVSYFESAYPGRLPIPESLLPFIKGTVTEARRAFVLLLGGLLVMIIGLVDDYVAFKPVLKLVMQFAIATVIVLVAPLRITMHFTNEPFQIVVTIVWLVAITNAFNLLDNMDGLTSTVAFFIGTGLTIVALQTGQYLIAVYMLTLLGSVCAFLVFNFPPASIFMGDCGALFIGYTLGTASILATFVSEERTNPLFPVLVPLVLFAVPLYDSASVLLIRFHHKRPLLSGDRNHFSHRLLRLGMGPRRVLFTVGLVTLATSLGATIPYGSDTWQIAVTLVQATAFILIIAALELEASEIKWDR